MKASTTFSQSDKAAGPETFYTGVAGEQYFARAVEGQELGAAIQSRFIARYTHKDDSILEFGCGGGFLLSRLCARQKIGVEINAAASRIAQQGGLTVVPRIHDVPGRYDLVISHHVLEHVANPFETLILLKEHLKRGGRLLLMLPLDDWRRQKAFVHDETHHLYTWTPQLLGNLLSACGFEVAEVRVLTHAWTVGLARLYQRIDLLQTSALRTALERCFDGACALASVALRRRQLIAVGIRP